MFQRLPNARRNSRRAPGRSGNWSRYSALVLEAGRQPAHHVPEVQLRHLVVAQVGYRVVEFLEAGDDLRALLQPAREANADEDPCA